MKSFVRALAFTAFLSPVTLIAEEPSANPPSANQATERLLTIAELQVSKDDLPEGASFLHEARCSSAPVQEFFESPDQDGALPKPAASHAQAFVFGGDRKATVHFLQYSDRVSDLAVAVLRPFLWGGTPIDPKDPQGSLQNLLEAQLMPQTTQPTKAHPEDYVRLNNVLVILCFPFRAPEAEWFRDQLRRKSGMPISRDWKANKTIATAYKDHVGGQHEKALQLLRQDWEKVQSYSFANYLLAELLVQQKDKPESFEKAYRRAIELDKTEDPLPGGGEILWASLDGLGNALGVQGELDECFAVTQDALALAEKLEDMDMVAQSEYVIAAVYVGQAKWQEAHETLTTALLHDPDLYEKVRQDPSFTKALERKEFQDLVNPQ